MKNRITQPTAAGKLTNPRSPHALLRSYILTGLVCLIAILAFAATSASAETLSPWWHLTSASRPTYLQPGLAKDEVVQLTVNATGGVYVLSISSRPVLGADGYKELLSQGSYEFSVGETPGEMEAVLQGLYGAGNVEVTGGPGEGTNPYEVYEIRFKGELAERPVSVPETEETARLIGGRKEASLKVLSGGRPDGEIVVTAVNLGDASANPEIAPIMVADKLPPGLRAVAMEGYVNENFTSLFRDQMECSISSVSCTFAGKKPSERATHVPPYQEIQMRILVDLQGGASGARSGEINEASVSGGGAPAASASQKLVVSAEPIPFGVNRYEMRPEAAGGGIDTQAGSHPFQLTTTLTLNEAFNPPNPTISQGRVLGAQPAGLTKDLHFDLPPGLIGNPTPFVQCPLGTFLHNGSGECPQSSQVGVARVIVTVPDILAGFVVSFIRPLFNLEPAVGEPARFGFMVEGNPVLLDTSVRTGGDYGVTVSVTNITQTAGFVDSEVTFWGVPGDPRHDGQRCKTFGEDEPSGLGGEVEELCSAGEVHPQPLLALPTSCSGPLQTTLEADSWQEPQNVLSTPNTAPMPALDGCNRLQFEPSISLAPDGQAGSTPTGLAVEVHVPQSVSLDGEGLAEADVKNTTVALPAGVAINPSGGDGLLSCSEAQIALASAEPPTCPNASKIGLVKIHTPLLPNDLEGAAYLGAQEANPFGSLVAIYVYVEDPVSGSRVKLAGEVVPNPLTGQLVTTFKNTPQLPFETFELHFFGGDRAPLDTPAQCGPYTTTAAIEPWTETGEVDSSSTFDVTSGPNGSSCQNPLPFDPTLTAGTTNINAGGFSPFTMTMSRPDGDQHLQAIELKMPPGLSGLLNGVELCPEPQADEGTCGPDSQIGETTVSVGVGGDPFSVKGGKVYITGPYEGAPFGLSIVNPAKAGPFDLADTKANHPACDCVLVRAKIEVNPTTAALTITSDNSGPYKIPTILEGIPLQIQHVNVTINRPDFTFNPTDCDKMEITGSLSSTEGATQALSVPFQATNCAVLAFAPKFAVSTSGKTSRADGASLNVKLTYPSAPFGIAGEHQTGQSRTSQGAALAVDDVAEGVHRGAVQCEPRGVPG